MLAWMFTDERWSSARRFLFAGALWGLAALAYEAVAAGQRVWPQVLADVPWASHGRVVAVASDLWVFGFLSCTLVAAALRVVGQADREGLWSEPLANLALWLWNAAQALAWWWLSVGWTRGRPLGEAPWPVDLLRLVGALLLAWVVRNTLQRAERQDAPVVLVAAGFAGLPLVLVLGKGLFWPFDNPYSGVLDALAQAFLRSGLVWLWLVPVAGGVTLYVLSALTGRPGLGEGMGYAALVALVSFGALAGPAEFVWGPVPFWSQTLGAVARGLLLLPVATLLAGAVRSVEGHWQGLGEHPGVALALGGWLAVLCGASADALASLAGPARVAQLSLWAEGVRLLVLGGAGAVAVGCAYLLTPHVLGRALASKGLAWRHVWLAVVGWALAVPALLLAGLAQGAVWATGTVPFSHAAQAARPLLGAAFVGVLAVWVGQGVFGWNLFLTADSGEPVPAAEQELAPVAGS
jgi:cbb3-type cytochrome oxidase subunit 1